MPRRPADNARQIQEMRNPGESSPPLQPNKTSHSEVDEEYLSLLRNSTPNTRQKTMDDLRHKFRPVLYHELPKAVHELLEEDMYVCRKELNDSVLSSKKDITNSLSDFLHQAFAKVKKISVANDEMMQEMDRLKRKVTQLESRAHNGGNSNVKRMKRSSGDAFSAVSRDCSFGCFGCVVGNCSKH